MRWLLRLRELHPWAALCHGILKILKTNTNTYMYMYRYNVVYSCYMLQIWPKDQQKAVIFSSINKVKKKKMATFPGCRS